MTADQGFEHNAETCQHRRLVKGNRSDLQVRQSEADLPMDPNLPFTQPSTQNKLDPVSHVAQTAPMLRRCLNCICCDRGNSLPKAVCPYLGAQMENPFCIQADTSLASRIPKISLCPLLSPLHRSHLRSQCQHLPHFQRLANT